MQKKIVFFLIVLLSFYTATLHSQEKRENALGWHEDDRIGTAVEGFLQYNKYKFGIIRYRPRLSLRSGFDGNAAFGDVPENSNFKENDYYVAAVPGISAGMKFGTRAYFQILQDFDLIYYFRNHNRSGVYGNTRAEFVTGSSQVLVTFLGSYYRKNDQVNQEIDEPVEHKVAYGDAIVEYSLSAKTDIRHTVRVEETKFVQSAAIIASGINLVDRREFGFLTGVGYALKRTLRLRGDIDFRRSEALDTNEITNNIEVLGGIELRRDRLVATFEVGWGRNIPETGTSRDHVLFDANADYRLTPKLSVGVFGHERYQFSYLSTTAAILQSEIGLRFNDRLANPLVLDGYYKFGKNDYGNQPVQGVVVNNDTYQDGELGLAIVTIKKVFLRPAIRYQKRNTNIPEFDKSNLYYVIGFGFGYTFNF